MFSIYCPLFSTSCIWKLRCMSEIIKSAIVPHNSAQMLALVNDIETYPEFLKWCKKGYVDELSETGYVAGMVIRIKGVQVEFATKNTIVHDNEITSLFMNLVSGPFKKMSGEWRFQQYPEFGSKVELQLQYEIKSQMLGRMFSKGFDQIAGHLVNDFVNRAGVIYANG